MRVYLSGKTSGMNEAEMFEFYRPYIQKLQGQGINQIILGSSLEDWQISQRLKVLDTCQALILVPGWGRSIECRREFDHAVKVRIQIRRVDQADAFYLNNPNPVLQNDFFIDD